MMIVGSAANAAAYAKVVVVTGLDSVKFKIGVWQTYGTPPKTTERTLTVMKLNDSGELKIVDILGGPKTETEELVQGTYYLKSYTTALIDSWVMGINFSIMDKSGKNPFSRFQATVSESSGKLSAYKPGWDSLYAQGEMTIDQKAMVTVKDNKPSDGGAQWLTLKFNKATK